MARGGLFGNVIGVDVIGFKSHNGTHAVNASISATKTVIATGGSVIYGAEAMEHLKEIGTVVYLKLDYETLDSRLGSLKGRGVVLKDGQNLESLYEERVPLYEKYADVIIDEGGLGLEETLDVVLKQL